MGLLMLNKNILHEKSLWTILTPVFSLVTMLQFMFIKLVVVNKTLAAFITSELFQEMNLVMEL